MRELAPKRYNPKPTARAAAAAAAADLRSKHSRACELLPNQQHGYQRITLRLDVGRDRTAAAGADIAAGRCAGRLVPRGDALLQRSRLIVRGAEGADKRHHRGPERQAVLLRPCVPEAGRLLRRFQAALRR